jgi:hypothetical protein
MGIKRNLRGRTVLTVVVLGGTLSSCGIGGKTMPEASSVQHSVTPVAPSTLEQVNGVGWTASGLAGAIPPPGSCHYRYSGSWVLPDPKCTPGAINVQVTQGNLHQTICAPGYTEKVRPPVTLTEPAKYALMAAYGVTGPPSHYEFDHLVPLELGGASTIENFWPEPNQGAPDTFNPYNHYGLNAKDGVELSGRYAVCSLGYSLRAAQKEMASNWVLAAQTYPK